MFELRVWGFEALGKHPRSTSKTSARGKLKLGSLKNKSTYIYIYIYIYMHGFPCPGQRYAKGPKGIRSSIHGGCSKGDSQKGRANPQDISMLAPKNRTHQNPFAQCGLWLTLGGFSWVKLWLQSPSTTYSGTICLSKEKAVSWACPRGVGRVASVKPWKVLQPNLQEMVEVLEHRCPFRGNRWIFLVDDETTR